MGGFIAAQGGRAAWADDTGPFSERTFGSGYRLTNQARDYALDLRARTQALTTVSSESSAGGTPAAIDSQIRRLRLRLSGWLHDPSFRIAIQLAFSRSDLDTQDSGGNPNIVRDASVIWIPTEHLAFSMGQSKLPGNRSRVVSSGELQMVDRSIVNRAFNLDRDVGLQARLREYTLWGAPWNLTVALTTGEGRNTPNSDTGVATTARLEWLPLGAFLESGDYFEGDLAHEPMPKLSVGAGYSRNTRTRRASGQLGASLAEARTLETAFADALLKYRGLSVSAEWMQRSARNPLVNTSAGAPTAILVGSGVSGQAGYLWNTRWEGVARYSVVNPRESVRSLIVAQRQATVGVNYYLRGHRIKFQADLTRDWTRQTLVSGGALGRSWIARVQAEMGL